jgi:PD-(D/E)XK nuclease superfamily
MPRKQNPTLVDRSSYGRLNAAPESSADPIVIRHSEIADFRQCPLKHRLSWVEGWHDPVREAGGARDLGQIWHEVLAIRYRELQKTYPHSRGEEDEFESRVSDAVSHVIERAHSEHRETLWWMYDGYVEEYGIDPELEVLSVEETLQVPFHDEDDQPLVIEVDGVRRPILYSWTTDIFARIRTMRGLFVIDTKSTAQPLGQMDIDLSDQFGLYTVAWRRLGENVRGQMVNQVKTKKLQRPMTLSERYDRKYSIRTPAELRNIELDAVDTIYAMLGERNRRRPYSSPDPRTCGWKCDFKEPHLRLRRNADPRKVKGILRSFGLEQGATHGQ